MGRDRLADVLGRWEPVIGLEIHTELTTLASKMFCGCPVAFGGEPNTRVCPVCLGLPGALPVPNEAAVEATVLAGLALDGEISRFSRFHRKNYFYPDMPKDYQISQYDLPFCIGGHLDVEVEADGVGYVRRVGVTRIHLEEDTGKMVHVGGAEGRIAGATKSLVDFNRAGTPLMELVTEPDIRHPEEARRFAAKLRQVFLTLGISDVNMEEGSLRVDANVSVRAKGTTEFGTKSEVKNMNSFKALHDALAYEVVRQADVLEDGGRVVQETRHWDAGAKVTSALRSKEEAHDYRYFPEPDMVPFTFDDAYVDRVRERLPELPDAKKARFVTTFGLPDHDATVLTSDLDMAEFYEAAVTISGVERAKPVANWMLGELSARLNAAGIGVRQSNVVPSMVAEIVALVEDGTISGAQAKEVFGEMAETGDAPGAIVEMRGMKQLSDAGEVESVVERVLAANPDEVASYRSGKAGLLGFFVGQVMKETRGQANPKVVNEVLRRKLG
ncbi:MAG: Asp-tRNA(Asn)/Glu-tRNA(Gln) amidotransferase subunit GatB [Coriobacteriia bacterium]|nr:Asp-tRNA(Asn)/Glu-tRNA(Gln) amidotransferase subunit GatB [Coriobacteriia bacterium]